MKGEKSFFQLQTLSIMENSTNYATNLIDLTSNKKSHAHHEPLY